MGRSKTLPHNLLIENCVESNKVKKMFLAIPSPCGEGKRRKKSIKFKSKNKGQGHGFCRKQF